MNMREKNIMEVPPDFDWKVYLELNQDIAKFPHYTTQQGSISHWKQFGRKEGRPYKKEKNKKVLQHNQIIPETLINEEPLKCIIIRDEKNNPFISVKRMVLSKYRHLPKYNNYLVVLGYNVGCNMSELREEYPDKKIVIYQLEQVYDNKSQWYNINSTIPEVVKRTIEIKTLLNECDEVWDYDIDNVNFLISEGFKNVIHVPLFYSSDLIRTNDIEDPTFDLLFYGSVNERRAKYLRVLHKKFNICIIAPEADCRKYKDDTFGESMIKTLYDDELFKLIFDSKIIINLHYYDSCIQEQVRLFEILINNKLIISEKSLRNYYKDLIIEFNDENDMVSKVKSYLKSNVWKNPKVSEKFKNLYKEKKKYKVGAIYNTFYGLEQIEDSINSIRDSVDYVILVHQKVGYSGNPEPKINKYIIDYLLSKKLIDEIVYYDNFKGNDQKSTLEKRNIGLEYCKKNNCDYVIPLDCDEQYNSDELTREINMMAEEGIDTLYSPIYSYYYDENHYFKDTYYVGSVFKVDDRKFEILTSSVLVDPVRKMRENNYKISEMGMHHYTYLKRPFYDKVGNSVAGRLSFVHEGMLKIMNELLTFSENKEVLVFANDLENKGNVILKNVKLIKK